MLKRQYGGISKKRLGDLKRALGKTGYSNRGSATAATAMDLSTPASRGGFGPYSKKIPYYRQPELKSCDTLATSTGNITTTAQFFPLNIPVSGAGFNNRVGNEIEMKSLHFVGSLQATGNAAAGNDYIRVIIFYDRQPNGANPAFADLITSYNSSGSTSSTSYDHMNPNNFDRFKILMDVRLAINNPSTAGLTCQVAGAINYTGEFNINRFIKLNGLSTRFKASAGAIGDITSGALSLCVVGQIATTAPYLLDYSSRLRYVD
nr:MAG: capsid protein [Cressdnaviricota sp.]